MGPGSSQHPSLLVLEGNERHWRQSILLPAFAWHGEAAICTGTEASWRGLGGGQTWVPTFVQSSPEQVVKPLEALCGELRGVTSLGAQV